MAIPLRQATASQEVPIGPFLDSTTGNDEETGLTIANTDIKLWKTGATTLANKNSGGATHMANGMYYAVLDATDSDTIGPLIIYVHVAGALYCKLECVVYDEAVYDVLFGTTAPSTYAGGAVASVTGNVGGNVSGTVGSVVAPVTAGTVSDKTGYALTAPYDPAKTAAQDADVEWILKWIKDKLVWTDNGDGTVTYVLYDTDNTTPLATNVYTKATGTRAKAT